MSTQVKHRRGNTAEIANFTPAVAELIVNTDDYSLIIGDGVTQGGRPVKQTAFNSVAELTGNNAKAIALQVGQRVGRYYYENGDAGYTECVIKTPTQANNDGDVIDGRYNVAIANGNVAIGQDEVVRASQLGMIVGDKGSGALNAQIIVDYVNATGKTIYLGGHYYIGTLPAPLTNKLRLVGFIPETGGLIAVDPWNTALATITANQGLYLNNIELNQDWRLQENAHPAGYNDATFAQNWGGYWLIESLTSDAECTLKNVHFKDVVRGVVTSANNISCTGVTGDTVASAGQCLVAGDSARKFNITDCDISGPRWDVEPYYQGFPVTGGSAFFGHDMQGLNINGLTLTGHQIVMRGETKGGNARSGNVSNLTVLSPSADTAFYYWDTLVLSGLQINYSLDMGLACESCRHLTIGNVVIDGTHVGGIAINDGEFISCTGAISIRNIAQSYEASNLFNRYSSGAGEWLSLVSISFKAGAAAGVENIIANVTAGFDNIPPNVDSNPNAPTAVITGDGTGATCDIVTKDGEVNKVIVTNVGSGYTTASVVVTNGNVAGSGATFDVSIVGGEVVGVTVTNSGSGYGNNSVAKSVKGVYVSPSPSEFLHTTTVTSCRVPDYRSSDMTDFNIFIPEHRFYTQASSRIGTPVHGEKFVSAGGYSFIYLSDLGDGAYCFVKRLRNSSGIDAQDIPAATAFVGETSGATLVTANPFPQLEWMKTVATGNYDYTTESPDGR